MKTTQTEQKSFFELSSRGARTRITSDIQRNIMGKNQYVRTLAIQNRLGFRETFYRAKTGVIVDLYALVSPTYTNNQALSSDPEYFTRSSNGLEARIPKKLSAAIEAIKLLSKYFNFCITIVVADTGLLLSEEYAKSRDISGTIGDIEEMYKRRVSVLLPETPIDATRLSRFLGQESKVVNMSFVPTKEDCESIIRENAIDPIQLLKNLGILIQAFGITVTYFELQAYFEESRLIGNTVGRSIILNIEGTSVGNKLLTKGVGNLCLDRVADNQNDRGSRKGGNLLIGGTVTL